ncbi:MAG TPA: prolyl oligopeptidase family serine peptidase [Pirellulaceae bacterium]|nr:prolyl oligopeptidase family serine peptidase [Pirellulaceae bacterium]
MRTLCLSSLATFLLALPSAGIAGEPQRLVPEDLYRLEGPQAVVAAPQSDAVAVIRRWIDPATKQERLALWWGDAAGCRALEGGEPDARSVSFQPAAKWMAIRSARPRPEGWEQITPVPPQSDVPTDIWLVSPDGKQTVPLAGPDKPYGRVFNDPFYGRVAYSPDGKHLAFIADDGTDPYTAEEREANVSVVRPDQGEGYTGYGTAQVWVADLEEAPDKFAAKNIRRLTEGDVWYGDLQWTPDGKTLIVHANKSSDTEAVRYSINKNYDLWAIDVESGAQRRLTFGPGPEVSPRISPDGTRLVCLSSPRKGPHADIYNLLVVQLDGDPREQPESKILFDHHAESSGPPPHPIPSFPLPDVCWDGDGAVVYTTFARLESKTYRVDVASGKGSEVLVESKADTASLSPAMRQLVLQARLSPPANKILEEWFKAEDRVVKWQNEGFDLEGALTLPPPEVAKAPYPLVLYPHGGPHSRTVKGFNSTAHVLAHAGYAVFQPNFRGSAGYGKKFLDSDRNDLGGGDMRDILAGIDMLANEKLIDRERQFVYGISYGGFMTSWLVGHTTQFRAAVAQNAVTEMNVMWGLSDIQSWTQHELSGLPWEVAGKMREHSPFAHAANIRTPTLILHSRDDRRCPLPMGKMFHQALLARGVPTQMVIYPDEGHGIRQPKHQVDVLKRTLSWFATHDVTAPVRIVTLGDSITKGVRSGVTAEETFATRIEAALRKEGLAAEVTNVGIGGERTDQALVRLEKDVIAQRPHVVTIMYGTNDSYVDIGKSDSRITAHQYRDNLVQLVERLRRAGIQPVLMTEPRWGAAAKANGAGEHPNVRLEKYVEECRGAAKELNVPLIDHYAHWTQKEKAGQNLGAWTTDQCHPNPRGHEELARLIVPVVERVVSRHRPPN